MLDGNLRKLVQGNRALSGLHDPVPRDPRGLVGGYWQNAMSERPNQQAAHYRARAEEVRARAKAMKDAETKRTLLQIAHDYERMADQLERLGLDALPSGRSGEV